MQLCISNPPYNLKWRHPDFAAFDPRFLVLPKENNANFAFIQTALDEADKSILILPTTVLRPSEQTDKECLKYLISQNWIEAVVMCPERMFASTSIAVCLLFLSKSKTTTTVELVDMKNYYAVKTREQNGQFGGGSHEKRTYKKEFNVFEQEHIDYILDCIANRKSESERCISITIEDIKAKDYDLRPSVYIKPAKNDAIHRPYKEIVQDINHVVTQKNMLKLTINKTLARNLGIDTELFTNSIDDKPLNDLLEKLAGEKIIKTDCVTFTANAVLKFENTSKEEISPILMLIFSGYKQHIYHLNQEENRYLAELRDALLPELMSGKFDKNLEAKQCE